VSGELLRQDRTLDNRKIRHRRYCNCRHCCGQNKVRLWRTAGVRPRSSLLLFYEFHPVVPSITESFGTTLHDFGVPSRDPQIASAKIPARTSGLSAEPDWSAYLQPGEHAAPPAHKQTGRQVLMHTHLLSRHDNKAGEPSIRYRTNRDRVSLLCSRHARE